MGELDAIREEISDTRDEIADIRVEIASMKPHVAQIPEIAKSLSILAEIMPRLEANMEEHKRMHFRMDSLEGEQRRQASDFYDLRIEHAACMERVRLETEELERKERAREYSTAVIIKKVFIAVCVTTTITFFAWLAGSHLTEYINRNNTTPAVVEDD